MTTKFNIGKLEVTTAAERLARKLYGNVGASARLAGMLARHAQGDWGDINAHAKAMNEQAVKERDRWLFSVYDAGEGDEFWVITVADRSKTKILLPTDF